MVTLPTVQDLRLTSLHLEGHSLRARQLPQCPHRKTLAGRCDQAPAAQTWSRDECILLTHRIVAFSAGILTHFGSPCKSICGGRVCYTTTFPTFFTSAVANKPPLCPTHPHLVDKSRATFLSFTTTQLLRAPRHSHSHTRGRPQGKVAATSVAQLGFDHCP